MPTASTNNFASGGFDRTNLPHLSPSTTFYDLVNLRPEKGQLEQTPLLVLQGTLPALGAESASQVRMLTGRADGTILCGTDLYFRYFSKTFSGTISQTEIPFVLQTAIPNNSTVNGEVLLYGANLTDFAAANDQIDVTIVSATQFKWRRNGGAWSADTTIALDQAIGGNGLRLAFMTTDGFTAADTWSWKRTTIPYAGTYPTQAVRTTNYNADVYVMGYDRSLMRVRNNIATSVGYRRIYGKYCALFYNHLVVGQYAAASYSSGAPADSYAAATTPWTLGWSHLNDPDQFFATDANEADTYTIPANNYVDAPLNGITGMATIGNSLFIYLSDTIYMMSYVGLPNVMQTDQLNVQVGSIFQNGLVNTPMGHFFIGRDNVYRFDGVQTAKVGFPVIDKILAETSPWTTMGQQLFGFYDADKCEVCWVYWTAASVGYQARMVCYQLDHNMWYFRNLPSNQIGFDVRCVTGSTTFKSNLYGGAQKIYSESSTPNSSNPYDLNTAGSGSYTQPYAETQDFIYGDMARLKGVSSVFLDGYWTTSGGANSDTALTVAFQARGYVSTPASLATLSQTWTQSTAERRLSYPQTAGTVHRYRFTFTGTKPTGCVFVGWQDNVSNRGGQQ